MHISHTHRAPAPPPSSLPDFAAQARTQRRAELLVDDVRGFFSGLGVEAHEGNDAAAGVVVDASYDNAAYVTTGSGPGYLHIGHDAEADRSFTAAPDVIAHEWAHRIVDTITGRTLSSDDYHPDAAVGESLADTFAAIYDGDDWTIGEDIGKPVRDMANPGALGHPGSVADIVPLAQHTDLPVQVSQGPDGRQRLAVEAHALAGIPNRAAALIGDALGRDALGQIYLKTTRDYVHADGGLAGLAAGTMQAAIDLFGAGSRELQVTRDAWQAVGLLDAATTQGASS